MMLRTEESDEKNQRSFEKSPSFKEKGFENPRLNKYLQEQPAQHRIPSLEADYSHKRTKVISYLNELLEAKAQMTDSKTRPGKNLLLQNKKLALNTRITSLKEQLSNAQKKSRHLWDSVKLLKNEISGLV
jgi:predicted RNA-binding protein